ncbi:MAG TPA: ABC transporter ATP-binding protein [Lapidilactobacillus dextrinicus]|uniref:Putative hemin import ATP-binding protein HrtA n=1 Tax=Lapidilactobacillus dextrinicus TaxID=51664 RepID=A0A921B371_9LACO|nr:ABC transporter ATP-binding protein [Lapidilactobacillus dextrinicus]
MTTVLELKQITKTFGKGAAMTQAIQPTDLTLEAGEFITLTGPSGSGKTTLLTIMGALQSPTSGAVLLNGQDLAQLSEKQRSKVRFEKYGFILQASNLIPYLSVTEQFKLVDRLSHQDNQAYANELLQSLGLEKQKNSLPKMLSGGQRQRVAIARALYHQPQVVFADEPTASLDSKRAHQVVQTLKETAHAHKTAVVMVTHDESLFEYTDQVYQVRDGQLSRQ